MPYDAGDPEAVEAALQTAQQSLGPIGTLVYNAGGAVWSGIETLSPDAFTQAWKAGPFGLDLRTRSSAPRRQSDGQLTPRRCYLAFRCLRLSSRSLKSPFVNPSGTLNPCLCIHWICLGLAGSLRQGASGSSRALRLSASLMMA